MLLMLDVVLWKETKRVIELGLIDRQIPTNDNFLLENLDPG